uniref:Uncharacterized protein n=1 Tax=Caenorhabditis japonica TaxID=281687 RepID=A0A8R1DN17_CAEJA
MTDNITTTVATLNTTLSNNSTTTTVSINSTDSSIVNTTENVYLWQRCYDNELSSDQNNIAKKVCKFVAMFNHFFMCLTASIFFAESLFASSMVHGKADKNGTIPWPFYYLLPIILAIIPTLGAYFPEKQYYGTAYLHCFAVSTVDMLWAFVIPVWAILTIAGLKSQLACIACDRQQPSQDSAQCYWARRSVKSLVLISQYLFSIWLMILFAAEHQTCKKWAGSGCFSSLYAMCPPKPEPADKNDNEEKREEEEDNKKLPLEETEPTSKAEQNGAGNQKNNQPDRLYSPGRDSGREAALVRGLWLLAIEKEDFKS